MPDPELDPSSPASNPHLHRQLAEIRVCALTLLDRMRALEPKDGNQAPWPEHAAAIADLVAFLDFTIPQHAGAEDLAEMRKQLQDFGALVRDRRDRAGFTRRQLGRLAKVSDATIKFIETARHPPSRKTLIRLLAVAELGLTWEDVPVGPGATRPSPPRDPAAPSLSPPAPEPRYGTRAEAELAVILGLCCNVDKAPSSFVFRNAVATVLLAQLGKVDAAAVKESLDRALSALEVPSLPEWFRLEFAERLRGTNSAIAWLLGTLPTDALQNEINAVSPAPQSTTPQEKT